MSQSPESDVVRCRHGADLSRCGLCAEMNAHPCGHADRLSGCGGCDPSAIEFVRDDGGPWQRVIPPVKGDR